MIIPLLVIYFNPPCPPYASCNTCTFRVTDCNRTDSKIHHEFHIPAIACHNLHKTLCCPGLVAVDFACLPCMDSSLGMGWGNVSRMIPHCPLVRCSFLAPVRTIFAVDVSQPSFPVEIGILTLAVVSDCHQLLLSECCATMFTDSIGKSDEILLGHS